MTTITLHLPDDLAARLAALPDDERNAALSTAARALDGLVSGSEAPPAANGPANVPALDVLLVGLTGTIHSQAGQGGSRLSESTGKDFADDLAAKHHALGRL